MTAHVVNLVVSGVFHASILFLVSAGLQVVFGVQKIFNLACGSFYALGAYVGVSAVAWYAEAGGPPALFILPLAIAGETWGDEIYFQIPVHAKPEKPRATVELGDLGYWPPGSAFCIFFGRTPSSRGDEIRPASPVNVVGRVSGDATVFKNVRAGTRVTIERGAS